MLKDMPVAEVTLNALSRRVCLAKSNVLRYFDSREAIFLEVLDQTWTAWLDDLDLNPGEDDRPYARETRVGTAVAASLVEQPLLCDLFAAMAAVLERNISLDVARDVKRRFSANTARLAGMVRAAVPVLDDAGATHFAGAVVVLVAGLAPHATPTETVVAACTELGLPCGPDLFAMGLTEGLVNQLIGLAVRARTR
jgi:AcrR family transcriptional regulator